MTTLGIDVYSGNGHVDFVKARDEDHVAFVIRKATEGVTYQDPGFAADYDRIVAAGLLPGAYHFAHPSRNTPQAEAANFLRVLGIRRGCLLALDFEDNHDTLTPWQRATWALQFLGIVTGATAIRPLLYTYHAWAWSSAFAGIRAARYPLWVPLDPIGADPVVQWTHVLGTLGNLDVDTFAGNLDQLRALAGVGASPPAPSPNPNPHPSQEDDDMALLVKSSDPADVRLFVWTVGTGLRHITGPELGVVDRNPAYVTNPGAPEQWGADDIASILAVKQGGGV